MKKRRIWAFILAFLLLFTPFKPLPLARAEAQMVVTLGADLSEEQKQEMFRYFGVTEDQVTVIMITNQDEREQLGNLIPLEVIGSHTYSCAFIKPTETGGIQVKTANMNYVTSNMIASTLSTSGVINCDVLTAAPFVISGTGALTGVMMAYETASGEELDEEKKNLANKELVITNDIAETVGQDEATLVVNGIKIYVIRDQLKEQGEINAAVENVIQTTENAAADRAARMGLPEPKKLTQEDHTKLCEFGYQLGQMDYNYDDMKTTLERVTVNTVQETGIFDPLVTTFETTSSESTVTEDSILANTDDSALGEDAGINTTYQEVKTLEQEGAEPTPMPSLVSETAGNRIPLETATGVYIQSIGDLKSERTLSFIDESNRITVQGADDKYALANVYGYLLTDYLYASGFDYRDGLFTAILAEEGDGLPHCGVLDNDGNEVIPFVYNTCKIADKNWVIGVNVEPGGTEEDHDFEDYNHGYLQITQVDVYHVSDNTAALAGTLGREDFVNCAASEGMLNIQNRAMHVVTYNEEFQVISDEADSNIYTFPDGEKEFETFYVDNKEGVRDREGRTILAPEYDGVYSSNYETGYFEIYNHSESGAKHGLADVEGNVVLPPSFDYVTMSSSYSPKAEENALCSDDYATGGYFRITIDDKMGFASEAGTITCPPAYTEAETKAGTAYYAVAEDGSRHLVSADGYDVTLSDAYSDVDPVDYAGGMLWKGYYDSYSDFDVFDWHGTILGSHLSRFEVSGDGHYVLMPGEENTWLFYELNYYDPEFTPSEPEVTDNKALGADDIARIKYDAANPLSDSKLPLDENGRPIYPGTEAAPLPEEDESSEEIIAEDPNPPEPVDPATQIKDLLGSAVALIEYDAEGNADVVKTLLEEALKIASDENPTCAAVLQSAVSLIDSGTIDAEALTALLNSAGDLL